MLFKSKSDKHLQRKQSKQLNKIDILQKGEKTASS